MSPNDPTSGWIDPNPPDATKNPRAERVLILAGVALTVVVLLAFVGVVIAKHAGVFGGGDDTGRQSVSLIAANVAGHDPFMSSVVVAPVEIADTVATDVAAFTAQLPRSAGRGVRLVPGTQPGLYGSAGVTSVCDVPAVANYLDAHPDRSALWAKTIGIAPQRIPYYLNTLTPVALIADTWVTASGFTEQQPVTAQTVLQAGTAVLIDQAGVPRVHCASGNPLTPPANIDLSTLAVHGEQWPEFAAQSVIAVAYSAGGATRAVDEFELRDVTTGEIAVKKAGGTIAIGTDPAGWSPDVVAMNVPPEHR